jgi:hypothetical protein
VLARTTDGTPTAWRSARITFRVGAGSLPGISDDEFVTVARAAAAEWRDPSARIRIEVTSTLDAAAGSLDGENTLVGLTKAWGRTLPGGQFAAYEVSSPALTTTYFVDNPNEPRLGAMLDADIELNAVNYKWGTQDPSDDKPTIDLHDVLVKSFGQALGLAASCATSNPADVLGTANPNDPTAPRAPSCFATGPEVDRARRSALYPFLDLGVHGDRHPDADDRAGVAFLYP